MLQKIQLEHVLFLDIETVPEHEHYTELDEELKDLWAQKTLYQRKEDHSPDSFYNRAGIWAEFGKIICVSVGFFTINNEERSLRVTSFYGEEIDILHQFTELLDKYFNKAHHVLCAHNGKEFDFPFLARRMIINNLPLPNKLNLLGKKPWEVPHLDTMELWKFGDYKHFTSLKLLTKILGVPSPKDDIDGSQVAEVYYKEKNLDRIIEYCEKDVVALAQVFLRLRNEALILPTFINYV